VFVRIVFLVLLIYTPSCFAQDIWVAKEGGPGFFNINFGISHFDGILGLEYQYGHHSVGAGAPGHFSYRYYYDLYDDSVFWGLYSGRYDVEDEKTVDGVLFLDYERRFYGVGTGRRWQWPSGWNVTTSLVLEYYEKEYSSPSVLLRRTEDGVILLPGIAGGYRF
jgi:hypothetical protein